MELLMQITKEMIPLIEKALNIKLYEGQKKYLMDNGSYWYGGRGTGKTLAYYIKLALSDGKPLDMRKLKKYCDPDYGPPENKMRYALRYFYRLFRDIWSDLKSAGFPVRKIIGLREMSNGIHSV